MKFLSDQHTGAMLSSRNLKLIIGLSIIVGILSIGGLIALIVLWHTKLTPFKDYAVVVDAGSTRSTIFVYTWPADKSDGLGSTSRVSQLASCKLDGGPITSIKNPSLASLQKYFGACMTNCTNKIPSTRKRRALIFLGGTAGLRLADMSNSTLTNAILDSTREYFDTLGLLFKSPENQVRIISGSEEGLSGWISTNILMNELYTKNIPADTYGVSDIGGASTQISFFASEAAADKYTMNLFNTDYAVYSHSFLCYGAEQIRRVYLAKIANKAAGAATITDPCLQKGYSQNVTYADIFGTPCARDQYEPQPTINPSTIFLVSGTGNSIACSDAVKEHMDKTTCTHKSCSFDNVYQPEPIPASLKFIAISAWWSTFNSLAPNINLSPNQDGNYNFSSTTFPQITTAIAGICDQPWSDVVKPDAFRQLLCFNSMYHWTLLQYGYGMTDANLKNFQIVKAIGSNEIGWALGYMINQTNSLPAEMRPAHLLTEGEFGGLLFLCAFLLIASIIIIVITALYFKQRGPYK